MSACFFFSHSHRTRRLYSHKARVKTPGFVFKTFLNSHFLKRDNRPELHKVLAYNQSLQKNSSETATLHVLRRKKRNKKLDKHSILFLNFNPKLLKTSKAATSMFTYMFASFLLKANRDVIIC